MGKRTISDVMRSDQARRINQEIKRNVLDRDYWTKRIKGDRKRAGETPTVREKRKIREMEGTRNRYNKRIARDRARLARMG